MRANELKIIKKEYASAAFMCTVVKDTELFPDSDRKEYWSQFHAISMLVDALGIRNSVDPDYSDMYMKASKAVNL